LTSYSNRILYVVSLNHAVNDGSVYLLSSLFPVVLGLFNISVFQVGIIVALGYLVNILFQPVVGHYSEGRDPGRILAIGISVIIVSMISFVFATGFLSLLASVILLRLGSSFFHPVGISTISKSYSGPRLQKSMGFQSAFGNVGAFLVLLPLVFLFSLPFFNAVGFSTFIYADDFFNLIFFVLVASGFAFTIPAIFVLLVKLHVIGTSALRKNRKYVWAATLVATAVASPDGGPLADIALFVPMIILIEGAMWFAKR